MALKSVLTIAVLLLATDLFAAREIGRYGFLAADGKELVDFSGFGNGGALTETATVDADGILTCGEKGWAVLPAGASLWGSEAHRGSVSLWVRPGFAPDELETGAWEGYRMAFYAMQTDGNGLPDGYDEIGIWCHGPLLHVKVTRTSAAPTFSMKSPLKKGEWTHLAVCWKLGYRAFYVDGALIDEDTSQYEAPRLDDFPAMVGQHPSSEGWAWQGDVADCRLLDDALTADEVQALAKGRDAPDSPEAQDPRIETVDWDDVWLGEGTVQVRMAPETDITGLQAFCEVLSADGRETFPLRPFTMQEQAGVASVACAIRREGPSRVNLILTRGPDKRAQAGRSHFINVPALSPTLTEAEGELTTFKAILKDTPGADATVVEEALGADLGRCSEQLASIKRMAAARPRNEKWEELISQADSLANELKHLRNRAVIYARGVKNGALPEFGIGVDHGLRKYLKHDPFEGRLEAPLLIKSARHEYEAAQVVVFALDRGLEGVAVETSDLIGPDGATIPAANITWNPVGYVETRKPTYKVRHVGLWPDPLLPPVPFDVAQGSFESVWLTVYVPRDARAGDYEGTVKIAPRNARAREVPVRLHVWDFALPEKLSLVSAFGLNCMGALQQTIDMDKYVANAHRHRISLGFPGIVFAPAKVTFPSFDFAGETLRCRIHTEAPEDATLGRLMLVCRTTGKRGQSVYGPIKIANNAWADVAIELAEEERPTSLRLEYRDAGPVTLTVSPIRIGDRLFDAMDKPEYWATEAPWTDVSTSADGLVFKVSSPAAGEPFIEQWPHIERAAADTPPDIPWGFDFGEFDARIEKYLERGINCIRIPVPGCPRHTSEEEARELVRENGLGPIAKAYQDHLEAKGWLDYAYTYVSDEPESGDYAALNVVQGTIKQWAPKLKNLLTARSFPEALKFVDIWCPEVYSFNPTLAAAEQAKGKQVWWYPAFSTRHPFPDFWIDYPAIDNRILFWLTWKHELDGLLYWSATNWYRADPWKDPMTFPGANGDGTLLYPGEDGAPVNSIRWECIRDGSEDYDYFVLLRKALADARRRAPQPDADIAKLMQAAERLLSIDDGIAKSWREWSFDPDPLIAARDEMGETIESLQEVAQ